MELSQIFGQLAGEGSTDSILISWLDSPLGPLAAGATGEKLVFLEFHDRIAMEAQVTALRNRFGAPILEGENEVLAQIRRELDLYFEGKLKVFETPFEAPGTPFQEQVWRELVKIPFGETISYGELANRLGNPKAVRAVGKANGENRLGIIIPCHRVIAANGKLQGYGGGLWRKDKLLQLEAGF